MMLAKSLKVMNTLKYRFKLTPSAVVFSQGDSGGPLIMWGDDGRYYLMGIVSFGKKCATPGYPGAYTRVTKQLEWLNHNF